MICPKCMKFEHHDFCPDCGTAKSKFFAHNCACGEELGRYQKFCSQCGRAAPEVKIPEPSPSFEMHLEREARCYEPEV